MEIHSSIRNIIDNMKKSTIISFFALLALAAAASTEWLEVMEDDSAVEGEMREGNFCYNLYSKDECTTKFVEKGKCDKAKAMRYCASACGHCSDVECKDIKPAEICEARKAEDRCGYEKTIPHHSKIKLLFRFLNGDF